MNTLPDHATGVLSQFATTSTQIDVFSDQVIESVKSGEADVIDVLIKLRAFERASERILKEIKDELLTAAERYPGNSFEYNGNKIEKAELGTKYDFAVCGDTEWEQFKQQEEQWAVRRKEREALLKAMVKPQNIVDDNGELITINPPTKKSTTGLKVTIK